MMNMPSLKVEQPTLNTPRPLRSTYPGSIHILTLLAPYPILGSLVCSESQLQTCQGCSLSAFPIEETFDPSPRSMKWISS
ncbi:hypothetical protein OF83DRAFT_11084 [Amylostereum chailletii]|nr:hypothetical protein OF83DRAFT_11084 [Amylostereum chailletii]